MKSLPPYLQPFQNEAENIIAQGKVLEIDFSGGTYQIQVQDLQTQEDCWAFIQLDSQGNIKDCFCSCGHGEDRPQCAHIAAAFLKIYNQRSLPLHQRFQRSLWNQLCIIFSARLGQNPAQLEEVNPGHYVRFSPNGKVVFSVQKKSSEGKLYLKDILEDRPKLTEENSLKFSNLSQEELEAWRSGEPSEQLKYELSFWSDLAHWLMMQQEISVPYQIKFKDSDKGIPNQITISFPAIELSFYLSEANLPFIIPTLSTVDSPLKIFQDSSSAIASIVYDQKKGTMKVTASDIESATPKSSVRGYSLDGWEYVKNEGFYAKNQHPLLDSPVLKGPQIAEALTNHTKTIQQLLKGVVVHTDPVKISYSLNFDTKWNLHIKGYVFKQGDLLEKNSRFYGNWFYLENDGFYPVKQSYFKAIEKTVSEDEMADFIGHERNWLNQQEGFVVHLASIEDQLDYILDKDNRLRFHKKVEKTDVKEKSKEFNGWVYVKEQGFYPKKNARTNLPLQADHSIGPEQIPLFIKINRAELQLVQGFFSYKCPVGNVSLSVVLDDDEEIHVTPHYETLPEYQDKDVRFFEDIVYIPKEGFYELPSDLRLPEAYRRHVKIDSNELIPFISTQLQALEPFIGKLDPRLAVPMQIHLVALSIQPEDRGGYTLKLGYETEHGIIPVVSIWQAFKKKKRYLFSKKGLIDLSDQQFDWVRKLSKNQIDKADNIIHLSTIELIRLNALSTITPKDTEATLPLQQLVEFLTPDKPNLTGLKSQLRTYQEYGVHWLWFLYQHHLSGLLCDDMGLGKTHQAMALLTAVSNFFNEHKEEKRPHFLIVCPTSVLFHWQEKLADFLPELRICTFYGSDRNLDQFHNEYDILLTSYGIWRLENNLLSKISYEVAIFDEIQIAKNQNSRIHASLLKAKARMRLGLTGTPIENRLRELKSLFDVVLPSYMPGEMDYRKLFIKPIEKENNDEKRHLLKNFIKPFILRRRKEEVLLDLPEKIEEIAYCELSADQQQLYTQTLNQSRTHLLQQLHDPQTSVPYLHIFALLSNLKQICDHPAVYLKSPSDYENYESGKWDLFVELLQEARDSQQKVVIFTQYLMMLDIFAAYLNKLGVGFASIRGATIDRGAQIYRFNHDPECEVFLGSLQAAGLGVDLTAGSVVIHYDRWWNAAKEDQATDRVHRIGQTRGVQVFKLVTKNTFEERINALIKRKARLLDEVVSVDDHRFMKQFSRDELIQLLQGIAEPE